MDVIKLKPNEFSMTDGLVVKDYRKFDIQINGSNNFNSLDDIKLSISEKEMCIGDSFVLKIDGVRITSFNRIKIQKLYRSDFCVVVFLKYHKHTASARYIIDESTLSSILREKRINSILQ
tara:strand:- start:16573 stop:16932 length:360 start_codon:yes stop_codon:yes gene_type:complete